MSGTNRARAPVSAADRAQSEVVGVLLLTGVIVVAVGLVGTFVLSSMDTTSEPETHVDVAVGSSTVTVTHGGGAALAATDVTLVFGGGGSVGLETTTELLGDGDDRFEGGERREASHGASGVLEVTIVHEPTNTVIERTTADVPT